MERPADARLAELLGPDGPPLVTLHGLGGSGTSTSVRRALAGQSFFLVDVGASPASRVRSQLARAPERSLVFVDGVHEPAAARAAIRSLARRSSVRVVVAARAPLGLEGEHRVALGLFDRPATERILAAELERLGVRAPREISLLASWVDGWLPAVRATALSVRVLGLAAVLERGEPAIDADAERLLTDAVDGLSAASRRLARVLSLARAPLDAVHGTGRSTARLAALSALVDRGLVSGVDGSARMPVPVATFVRARETRLAPRTATRARAEHAAWVLASAERARVMHRADPTLASARLEALRAELVALTADADPRTSVAATLALEPLLFGRLPRPEALSLLHRALVMARVVGKDATREVTVALVRAHIARGDHESAEALLRGTVALGEAALPKVYRAIYLGHVAAWRGALTDATVRLDEAAATLERAAGEVRRLEDAREDLLVQRMFVALLRGELEEAERFARRAAVIATDRPSPRLGAIARRFVAEVTMSRGEPAVAATLFRASKDELVRFGDHAGALFLSSRLVAALRAAGDEHGAKEEARAARTLAADAGESTLELTLLDALDGRDVPVARIRELAWRVQIPALRERVERWLAEQPTRDGPMLRLHVATASASMEGRRLALGRRATLWRVLEALVDGHRNDAVRTTAQLFAAGWPGERVAVGSQRKRVQTAVWTLRRGLLGVTLRTVPDGYALAPDLRVLS